MAKKLQSTVGIEYDQRGIRLAKLTGKKVGSDIGFYLDILEERTGDFSKEDELVKVLKDLREAASIDQHTKIVTCVSGKQIYAAEVPFRKLPDAELKNALRFELRKNVPFELAGATLECQIVDGKNAGVDKTQIIAAAAANTIFNKQLSLMERAELRPDIVDVLPTAIGNVFWALAGKALDNAANVVLHVGPAMCTLIIVGQGCPFFHRSIYFSALEILAANPSAIPDDGLRKLDAFGDEIVRSLSFYMQTYGVNGFAKLYVLGDYAADPRLVELISRKVSLAPEPVALAQKCGVDKPLPLGKFDLAISLAMRTDFE